ncbi:MAG: ABC transporter permease [Anaerolineae bacterium]
MQLTKFLSQTARGPSPSPVLRRPLRPARRPLRRFAGAATILILLALWQLVTVLEWVDPFLLPPPIEVAQRFGDVLADGRLWLHTRTTLVEVLAGLGIGLLIGLLLGYAIARNRLLEDLLAPIVVMFQATPVVAYAPLLVIWFGSGATSKIITAALIVFFPMLMNTVVGIRGVPVELRDLMRVSQATPWQVFTKLELPAAMPVLLTGIKTSATLAVIGAVVGEFIVANAGLGFLMNLARSTFDTALVFVAIITLALLAGTLYSLVSLLERRLLAWQRQ